MVKLNLLPAKVRDAEILRFIFIGAIAVYLVVAVIIAWRFSVANQERSQVEAKIRRVEAELLPLQAIADEVKKLTAEKSEQDAKKGKLSELAKRQAYLVRVLDLLPDLMQNGQVWLTLLDQSVDKNLRRMGLTGKALSVEAWADFYNNLESQSLVTDLKIEGNPIAVTDGKRKLFTFRVSFILKDNP